MSETKTGRQMLNRWAATVDERRIVEDFIDWADAKYGAELHSYKTGESLMLGKLLDAYHEIDQKQLEAERRALLLEAE